MSEPIRGKVARVLNSREIALTVGSSDGVVVGMFFDVMDPKGEDITDPDTGDILGSVERPKVRVQITKVQERLSVASTYRKTKKILVDISQTLDRFLEFLCRLNGLQSMRR